MSGNTNFTQHEDVFLQILKQWDASLDSMVSLLRLRATCTTAKKIVDAILEPGQTAIPPWLAALYASKSAITDREVRAAMQTPDRDSRYIELAEIFRTLQQNYYFDERVVGVIFYNMKVKIDDYILAIRDCISHNYYEGILLLGDVLMRAMRCYVKNRDTILYGCKILCDTQGHSKNCEWIGQQLPIVTDALNYHRNDMKTVSGLLLFLYRVNKSHQFFRHNDISTCGVEKCDKFSAALADAMQCHMHSNAWLNVQSGVCTYYYTRRACVNISCNILGQVWKIKQDEYYTTVGFADSVKAVVAALHAHKGRSALKSASNAVRVLLRRVSVGCPGVQRRVNDVLQASGWTNPTKRRTRMGYA